jgi:4-hydroxy-L-threonine phosphate dehydrogenase PdxA
MNNQEMLTYDTTNRRYLMRYSGKHGIIALSFEIQVSMWFEMSSLLMLNLTFHIILQSIEQAIIIDHIKTNHLSNIQESLVFV